jgi:hypothetical protein
MDATTLGISCSEVYTEAPLFARFTKSGDYTQTPQVVQGSMSAMAMLQRLSEISADRVRT